MLEAQNEIDLRLARRGPTFASPPGGPAGQSRVPWNGWDGPLPSKELPTQIASAGVFARNHRLVLTSVSIQADRRRDRSQFLYRTRHRFHRLKRTLLRDCPERSKDGFQKQQRSRIKRGEPRPNVGPLPLSAFSIEFAEGREPIWRSRRSKPGAPWKRAIVERWAAPLRVGCRQPAWWSR